MAWTPEQTRENTETLKRLITSVEVLENEEEHLREPSDFLTTELDERARTVLQMTPQERDERLHVIKQSQRSLKTEAGKLYLQATEQLDDEQLDHLTSQILISADNQRLNEEERQETLEWLHLYGSGEAQHWHAMLDAVKAGQDLTAEQDQFLRTRSN